MLLLCLFCLLSRGSVYIELNFNSKYVAFAWLAAMSLALGVIARWYGLARPFAKLPQATLLASLADLV